MSDNISIPLIAHELGHVRCQYELFGESGEIEILDLGNELAVTTRLKLTAEQIALSALHASITGYLFRCLQSGVSISQVLNCNQNELLDASLHDESVSQADLKALHKTPPRVTLAVVLRCAQWAQDFHSSPVILQNIADSIERNGRTAFGFHASPATEALHAARQAFVTAPGVH